MNIQEYRGIRGVVAAEVTTDDSEKFECGTPFELIGAAELSRTTETSSEAHYYDNVPAVVIDSTGSDEVTITGSVVPFDVLAKITGQTYDEAKGMFVEGERVSKYFALGYITEKTDGTDAEGQELVFTGINTNHKFTATGKTARAINVDTSVNTVVTEAEFFGKAQTPDTVTAAA